ncbi:MAG TPA: hypothetical protein VKT28_05695 [Puia sp.]|nr:hypothetical protein [Puia sp.]
MKDFKIISYPIKVWLSTLIVPSLKLISSMTENVKQRNWLRVFSPAVLGIGFSVVGVIISYSGIKSSGGWSFLGVLMLAPVIAILIGLDFIVKDIFRNSTLLVWVTELFVLGFIYFFWIRKFTG